MPDNNDRFKPRIPERKIVPFTQQQSERLVRFYEQAEKEIINEISKAIIKGNDTRYLEAMKKNVNAILTDLRNGTLKWCEEAIPQLYTIGLNFANRDIADLLETKGVNYVQAKAGFAAIHQQAAQALADVTFDTMDGVIFQIGRTTKDIYREMTTAAARSSVIGSVDVRKTAKTILETLADKGVTGFVDRAGHKWNMSTYTRMASRTCTMNAHLEGTFNRLQEYDIDLVRVASHTTDCKKCLPWQGKILSLTGKTPNYPTLIHAKEKGLFHPNCEDSYGAYIPELQDHDGGDTQ